MSSVMAKYVDIQKRKIKHGWKIAKQSKICYAFLLPYAILFTLLWKFV